MLKWIRAYAVLLGVLIVSLPVVPLLAYALKSILPRRLENFMFFWPQHVLVPGGFRKISPPFEMYMFDSSMMLAVGSWLCFLAFVAVIVRSWKVKWIAVAVFPIVLVTVALYGAVLRVFGLAVALDGP